MSLALDLLSRISLIICWFGFCQNLSVMVHIPLEVWACLMIRTRIQDVDSIWPWSVPKPMSWFFMEIGLTILLRSPTVFLKCVPLQLHFEGVPAVFGSSNNCWSCGFLCHILCNVCHWYYSDCYDHYVWLHICSFSSLPLGLIAFLFMQYQEF